MSKETKMKQKKPILRLFLLLIGLGFSAFIGFNLYLILQHGSIKIFEPNKWILVQEIITVGVIIVLYGYQLSEELKS